MVEITKLPPAKATGALTKVLVLCKECDLGMVPCQDRGTILQMPRRAVKTAKFKCCKCGSFNVRAIHGEELWNRAKEYWGQPRDKRRKKRRHERYMATRGRPLARSK